MTHLEDSDAIDLKQYGLVFKRRFFPAAIVFCAAIGATAAITFLQKPTYQAQGELLFKKNNVTTNVTVVGKEVPEIHSPPTNPLDTEVAIVRSVATSEGVMQALDLRDEEGQPLKRKDFLRRLSISTLKDTDVLQISFKSNDPQEAVDVVNRLMQFYQENDIQTNRAQAAAVRRFIEEQLPKSEFTVQEAEANLRVFKENNRIVALDQEASATVTLLGGLEGEITQAKVALNSANTRVAALRSQTGIDSQQAIALSALSQSEGVQKAIAELQAIENRLELERTRFLDEAPIIIDLENKQARLRGVLERRIIEVLGNSPGAIAPGNLQMGQLQLDLMQQLVNSEVDRLVVNSQLNELLNEYAIHKQRANALPRLQESQRDLERQVEVAQSTYQTLLTRLQEVRIAEEQNIGNVRVIQAAVFPERPIAPQKKINFGLGGVVGIFLAVVTALVLDAKDTRIKTVREAREYLGYTLLGIIPNFEKIDKGLSYGKDGERVKPKLPVKDAPRSLISESYRMLYANLKFLGSDRQVRVIAVTSAIPKEGKSTVSANLALAIAQLGFRVLLVDADMRHPSQQAFWDTPKTVGLSNIIVEQVDPHEAIAEVMPHLFVLTAGLLPPNPLALLNSRRMAALIEDCAQTYDFVILDTPPLSAAADARILSAMTDGMLIVVQPQLVDAASAIAAKELLAQSGQNVLGMVINSVSPDNEPDSYFYAKEYPMGVDYPSPTSSNSRLKGMKL